MNRVVILLLLSSASCGATEQLITHHPQKKLIVKNLQLLVDETAKDEENHFFARRLGQQDWIFWREGRLLMPTTLEIAVGDREISTEDIWTLRLRNCRKPIRLDSGVVSTRADIPAGTTYHVTRDYVADIVYDCVLNGELVVVKKKPNQPSQPIPLTRDG